MESSINEINNRQEGFVPDFSRHTAIVVGLGGVGSWVAVNLALIGVGTLLLFDTDKIEASNLNRTLFKLSQIDNYKTKATKELILERRKDCIVVTQEEYFNLEQLLKFSDADFIFYCSDTLRLKDSLGDYKANIKNAVVPKYIKLGYDGYSGTICLNDFNSGRWGTDSSYQIIPSFFGTPQVLSALAVIEMLLVKKSSISTLTFNVKTILDELSEK
jgi:hypothetical protein